MHTMSKRKNFLKSLVNIEEGSERLRFRCVSVCDVLSVMKGEVTQTEAGFTAAVQRTYVCVCVCVLYIKHACLSQMNFELCRVDGWLCLLRWIICIPFNFSTVHSSHLHRVSELTGQEIDCGSYNVSECSP